MYMYMYACIASFLDLIPRPHSQASFPDLIPRPHSQASFPGLIPRSHSQASFPVPIIPGSHSSLHSHVSFSGLVPRFHSLNWPHSRVSFPGLVPRSHSQASFPVPIIPGSHSSLHSHVSFSGLVPRFHSLSWPHSQVSFPGLIPRPHSQASFPYAGGIGSICDVKIIFLFLQSALGWDYQAGLSKHESQTDAAKGFGGRYGVQTDRQDEVCTCMYGTDSLTQSGWNPVSKSALVHIQSVC